MFGNDGQNDDIGSERSDFDEPLSAEETAAVLLSHEDDIRALVTVGSSHAEHLAILNALAGKTSEDLDEIDETLDLVTDAIYDLTGAIEELRSDAGSSVDQRKAITSTLANMMENLSFAAGVVARMADEVFTIDEDESA
jgi:methyl-accepting chemotaxis protein